MRRFILLLVFGLAVAVPLAAQSADSAPLSTSDIYAALKDKYATRQLPAQIQTRGVDFTPTPEIERQLRDAGANGDIISALRKAKVIVMPTPSGAMLLNADSDCTVSINGGPGFDMRAGETRRIPAAPGDNIVQATSKRDGSVWRKVVTIDSTGAKGVLIELTAPPQQQYQQPGYQQQGYQQPGRPASAAFVAGSVKVNAADGLPYVWIPAGTFQMGCSPGDTDCFGSERPAHAVTITRGFWMGQTLVTQAAYKKVTSKNPSHFQGDALPVEQVSWGDARAYCAAVGLRLPTEAEWEYAARAGVTAPRYGDDLDAVAWYDHNSGQQTHEVGKKQSNTWKLYDMLGNTWEWTADWSDGTDGNYYAQSPARDPQGLAGGSARVLRGGSWDDGARFVRLSARSSAPPDSPDNTIGFRCVGDVP